MDWRLEVDLHTLLLDKKMLLKVSNTGEIMKPTKHWKVSHRSNTNISAGLSRSSWVEKCSYQAIAAKLRRISLPLTPVSLTKNWERESNAEIANCIFLVDKAIGFMLTGQLDAPIANPVASKQHQLQLDIAPDSFTVPL